MDGETADLCRLTLINADALLYSWRREVILFVEAVLTAANCGICTYTRCNLAVLGSMIFLPKPENLIARFVLSPAPKTCVISPTPKA
jgi:hypothetical protein